LEGIAKALNEGELVRATFATLFMHLPSLSEEQTLRAMRAEVLFKASPDDLEHPGWPKGAEGGRGGQFRPKDESAATETTDRLARQVARQQIRMGLLYILRRHAVGLALHAVGDVIPGLDAVAGVATAADLAAMAEEYAGLKRDADAAIEFIRKGPYDLEQLRVSPDDEAFPHSGNSKRPILTNASVQPATAMNTTTSSSRARAVTFPKASCKRHKTSFESQGFCMRRSARNIQDRAAISAAHFVSASTMRAMVTGGTQE
jgi:hypothetical protein